MIKEAIGVGDTLEEATEKAKAELNASFDDDVQFEVLVNPKKKTLGIFGGCQAKVRVFVEVPDPVKTVKREKPKTDKTKKTEPKAEKGQPKTVKSKEPRKESKKDAPAPAKKNQPKPHNDDIDDSAAVPSSQIPADSPTGRSIAYLEKIFSNLGLSDVVITAAVGKDGAHINLEGEDLGIIIGRRGETLDSLQYLASLVANSKDGYFRISLNTGNYREKREQTLEGLAKRVADQVLRTGRSRALEPMNPYERRIIHTTVQEIEGVESNSTGEGSNRRVVISLTGEFRPNFREDRGSYHNSRGSRRNGSRTSGQSTVQADREPKKDADFPLYGKID